MPDEVPDTGLKKKTLLVHVRDTWCRNLHASTALDIIGQDILLQQAAVRSKRITEEERILHIYSPEQLRNAKTETLFIAAPSLFTLLEEEYVLEDIVYSIVLELNIAPGTLLLDSVRVVMAYECTPCADETRVRIMLVYMTIED